VQGSVCVFLEPIALYMTKDLHEPGDGGWLTPYPRGPGNTCQSGRRGCMARAATCSWSRFANGVWMSLRGGVASRAGPRESGCRVLDLRWLRPLPVEDLLREAKRAGQVLVVDETRRSGGGVGGDLHRN